MVAVAAASDILRVQAAADALKARENAWSPLAAQLGAWVSLEKRARELDGAVKTITVTKKWVTDHGTRFRNLRLDPLRHKPAILGLNSGRRATSTSATSRSKVPAPAAELSSAVLSTASRPKRCR